MKEACSGSVVGYDSNRVIDDSSHDKIGISSHEGAYAAGQPGQGVDAGQCFPDDVTTPQKAPNKVKTGRSVCGRRKSCRSVGSLRLADGPPTAVRADFAK